MLQNSYNTAKPIVDEINALNTVIPLLQAGTAVHIGFTGQFKDSDPYLKTQMTSFLATAQTTWLTQLQSRLTNRQTALAAVS